MEYISELPTEAVPCDNYSKCGNATTPEVAYTEWVRGFEGKTTRVCICEECDY